MGIDEISRRELLRALPIATVGTGLAGCGGESSPSTDIPASNTETHTESTSATGTRGASDVPTTSETPSDTPDSTGERTVARKASGTSTDSGTSSETPTANRETGDVLSELNIVDSDGLLQDYGEQRSTVDPGSNGSVHVIQMDAKERTELYREDLFEEITEEQYEEVKEVVLEPGPYEFRHYINRLPTGVGESSIEEAGMSPESISRLYVFLAKIIVHDEWEDELDSVRIGCLPQIRNTDTEENLVAAEIVNFDDDVHRIYRKSGDDGSFYYKEPGDVGIVDGEGRVDFGACEFEAMREEINSPWHSSINGINPDKLQGMIRDELIGFTNWNRVHEKIGFERREEAESRDFEPTPTPTPVDTPTPSPQELPGLQIAAHQPFVEGYRGSILHGDDTSKTQRIDLSDALTDYVLHGDHEGIYGLVVGGTVGDPDILEVGYEHREFFDAVHDLGADKDMTVSALAEEYRSRGTVPMMEG